MTQELLDQLDAIGTITHEEGVLLKLCFGIMICSPELSSPERRGAVLKILDEYTGLYDNRLRWTTNPKTERWKRLKGGIESYTHPREWLLGLHPNDGWEMVFHGGEKNTDATDISFYANGEIYYNVRDHYVSTLVCRFPLADIFSGRIAVPDLIARWCSWLQPLHARAGLAVGESFGYEHGSLSRLQMTDLLRRFPGLQPCDKVARHCLYDGPGGADWLIALSKHFVDKLGGPDTVKQAMSPLPVLPYGGEPGGLILQAGAWPQLGNAEHGWNLPEYEQVGRVIEPIRAKYSGVTLWVTDPAELSRAIPSKELRDQWERRFSPKAK